MPTDHHQPPPEPASALPPEWFARIDREPDTRFYDHPRFVHHIDAGAIAAVTDAIQRHVPPGAAVLDLMTSWVSHLPAPDVLPLGTVSGLGLNAEELARNPRLTDRAVQDLNCDPTLPYADAAFDAVLITVSIQYLTRPNLVLREVARVLRPGGVLIVSFSNRMYATKAVRIWQEISEARRPALVAAYLLSAGGFTDPGVEVFRPIGRDGGDPLWCVIARRTADSPDRP